MHARHFFKFIFAVLRLKSLPLANFAGMNHLAAEFERLLHYGVKECLVFYVIIIVVSASASENQVTLEKQCEHIVERRLLSKSIDPLMKYLLRLLIQGFNRIQMDLRKRNTSSLKDLFY